MIEGPDIRRYRRAIKMNQVAFARRVGLSQSALSQFESGRISVSDELIAKLRRAFVSPAADPSFEDFARLVAKEREQQLGAIQSLEGRFLTLTVWRWEEGFDLTRMPSLDRASGIVTVPATNKATIALEMPRETEHWSKGEILVFIECKKTDLQPDDACVVHYHRGRKARTSLAVVQRALGRPKLDLRLHGTKPDVLPDEAIIVLMRAASRIRHS